MLAKFNSIFVSWLCLVSHLICSLNIRSARNINRFQKSNLKMVFNFGGSSKIPANKKICVVTGTSSGLGKETAKDLLKKGNYYVILAVRDIEKMQKIADQEGFDKSSYSILELDLASFQSTKNFYKKLQSIKNRPLDRLVCNAAVYQPALPTVCLIIF